MIGVIALFVGVVCFSGIVVFDGGLLDLMCFFDLLGLLIVVTLDLLVFLCVSLM